MAWDETRLEALRARYRDASGAAIHDPRFREIADLAYREGDIREAPFAGMPTLLDAPARATGPAAERAAGLDVALYGMPVDLAVTNRPGARFGPRALRGIERIGPYNEVLDCAPTLEMKVADIGDVPFRSRFDLHKSHADITAFVADVLAAGAVPVGVGGDHSVSHPVLRAVGAKAPVGLIHIDAHCDTGGSYEGERFHHGGPFRNAVLDGVLDPTRTIQIGIRGSAAYAWEFSADSGMTVVTARDLASQGVERVIALAREVAGSGPTYLSFDVDSLDPAFAPGTGTPEVGGLTSREALALLRGLKGLHIVGGDVVEVAPSYDPTTNTALVAAQVLFEIVSLIQKGRRA